MLGLGIIRETQVRITISIIWVIGLGLSIFFFPGLINLNLGSR